MHDEVLTTSGRWRGRLSGDIAVFRGIRYAQAERFGPPRPIPLANSGLDATGRGPAAPQLPSRLEAVMGAPARYRQSPDCLRVTVTAPAGAEPGSRPVLVWLHGGAYLSGSGEWNLYDADQLVRETDIVVVAVSYRVGAFGYLRAAGVSPGNLGLLDQIAALEWIHDHIAEFGGDPSRVTVAGQSAGAQSVVAMLGIERTRTLFDQAIIQSAPLGIAFHSPGEAQRVADVFRGVLGADPREATDAEILDAQARAARRLAGRLGLNSAPPLRPVGGITPLPDEPEWKKTVIERAADLRVLIGTTVDEMAAFYGPHPFFSALRRVPVIGKPLAVIVQKAVQAKAFDKPTDQLADLLADAGAGVYRYRVGSLHPANPFGACHCIELPLLFGDGEAWKNAPMVSPLTAGEITTIGVRTREHWGQFVRTGEICGDWRMHRPGSRRVHALP
ncbi:putative carboxyesterase [Mycolicibacterium mageritense DSM 44476 = CIP 104973]|uniref:Carboxylic ester hydrolase n=1 Tax=Mycolicibacterium mageritense TaxID=53462 RepID=A0ABM7HX97_MYCME|nr:carboxylesterase family protein [Mycolicibacterium mageritense]MCC9183291.1 carboxylesterase family protein [Mycolicibacterium mageritense]BBX35227.1 carboxylic ester hydrolase [Mycolicibacterium mageritense]CDO20262.1 putative carboxylesterase [Mycolicibacterium mageritense DSM 44476 = CIP 104973]